MALSAQRTCVLFLQFSQEQKQRLPGAALKRQCMQSWAWAWPELGCYWARLTPVWQKHCVPMTSAVASNGSRQGYALPGMCMHAVVGPNEPESAAGARGGCL